MDSGNKFNCVEWFVWWILPRFIYSGCSRNCLPDLQCTSSATFVLHFFAWSCWVEVAKMKGPSLGCWVSMVSTWDEQLSAEQEGFCLKEPRKFSWFSGRFQLLLAPDSFSLYPENDVSYSIWGKCICPGSKFAVRYALCWSLAERHIWWLSNFDPTQKQTYRNCRTSNHGYQTTHIWFWKFLQGRGYMLSNFLTPFSQAPTLYWFHRIILLFIESSKILLF